MALLNVTEVADKLGTSQRFVRRLIAERRIFRTRSSASTSASLTPTSRRSSPLAGLRPPPEQLP